MDGTATEWNLWSPRFAAARRDKDGMTRMRSIVISAGFSVLVTLCACGNGPPEGQATGSGPVVGIAGPNLGTAGATVTANASLQFAPGTLTVATGEVLKWTVAQDSVPHNVTFDANGSLTSPATLGPGQTWEVKFTVPGTYAYRCTIHAGMNGQVTVTPGSAPAATSAAAGTSAAATPTPSP